MNAAGPAYIQTVTSPSTESKNCSWKPGHAGKRPTMRKARASPTWVTPQLLQLYPQYVRNHALLDRRLTPDLYTLVLAAKQMAGDDFAIRLLETAKTYSYQEIEHSHLPHLSVGLGQLAPA